MKNNILRPGDYLKDLDGQRNGSGEIIGSEIINKEWYGFFLDETESTWRFR